MQISTRPSGISTAASSISASRRQPPPPSSFDTNDNSAWLGITERLDRFDVALKELRGLLEPPNGRLGAKLASVSSASDLGLRSTQGYSALRSSAEVNATPTSFSTFAPTWSAPSTTATPTMTGAYTGTVDQTYTFEVVRADKKGRIPTQIEVRDSANNLVDNISISDQTPPGTKFTLNSGLVVSFGAGEYKKNDSFTVDAYAAVPSTVDPNKPLGGSGNTDPNLEYPLKVVDGSFTVNGTVVSVSATDSINDVLARIGSSIAGVSAQFDAATETIVLQQLVRGAEPIALADDTSGFLAAMKLTGAVLEEGLPAETEQVMADVARFSGVSAGSVIINGVSVAFDPANDSLIDVLARIESEADVNTILVDGKKVTLRGNSRGESLEVNSNGTGLFAALGIPEGIIEPEAGGKGRLDSRTSRRITQAVAEMASALNGILSIDRQGESPDIVIKRFGEKLREVVGKTFDTGLGSDYRSSIGLTFDLAKDSKEFISFGGSARTKFSRTVGRNYDDLYEAFVDPTKRNSKGMLDQLEGLATGLRRTVSGRLDLTL